MNKQEIKEAAKHIGNLSLDNLDDAYDSCIELLSRGNCYTGELMEAIISITDYYEQTHKERDR